MQDVSKDNGFSLIELLIVVVVVGLIAAIAVPNLLASRRSANEASALEAVRKIRSAQLSYYSSAGNGNYTTAAGLYSQQLIGKQTAAAANVNVGGNPPRNTARSGYRFSVQATNASPALGTPSTFVVSANPSTASGVTQTGSKRFCVRDDGLLKSSTQNLSTQYTNAQCGFASPFAS